MAEPKAPEAPEEKPAKAPRTKPAAKAGEPADPGINASIIGDPHGPRQELDLPDDDPGINANIVT